MNRSLSQIFFRQIHIIALCSALVISGLVVYTERTILINDLIDKGDTIAKVLSSVTLDAVLSHNYATMERYVREIADEPAIVGVAVRRGDGELLASAGQTDETEGHAFHHPVLLGETTFAQITIVFSTARIDRILRTIMLGAILTISFFHLLGIYISNLALRRAVINPIARLKDSIATIQRGQFHERCAIASPLELAELGSAFNDMADAIQRSFAQIEVNQKSLDMERSKLAAIVSNMADGLFVTDTSGVIISFNNSAERISGFSEADAIGHKCSDLFRSTLCRDACALYHAGETINNRPTTLTTKDGETLAVAVSSAMLFDSTGEAVGAASRPSVTSPPTRSGRRSSATPKSWRPSANWPQVWPMRSITRSAISWATPSIWTRPRRPRSLPNGWRSSSNKQKNAAASSRVCSILLDARRRVRKSSSPMA